MFVLDPRQPVGGCAFGWSLVARIRARRQHRDRGDLEDGAWRVGIAFLGGLPHGAASVPGPPCPDDAPVGPGVVRGDVFSQRVG